MKVSAPIIFKCNATTNTGFGHFSRCLNIANAIEQLTPQQSIQFCGDYLPFAQQMLDQHEIKYLTSLDDIAKPFHMVFDDYQLTSQAVTLLSSKAQTLIAIDDFNALDLSRCDLVVNFRVGFDDEKYQAKSTCLGAKFFPFKQALKSLRERNIESPINDVNHITIFIGGQDKENCGQTLLSALDKVLENKTIHLVSPLVAQANRLDSTKNTLVVKPLTANIEDYYQVTDFFISGGGLSKYEVSFCAIPNACISQNQGQADDSHIFSNKALTLDLGLVDDFMLNQTQCVKGLVDRIMDPQAAKLIEASQRVFDTNSCEALANEILLRCYE